MLYSILPRRIGLVEIDTTLFSDDEDDVEVYSVSPPEHASEDEDDVATKNDTTNNVATVPRSDPIEEAQFEMAFSHSLREQQIVDRART